MGKENPFISVVLSFFNEEESIPELVRRLRATLGKEFSQRYELVFVNDASTDRSLELLKDLARGHKDIKVLSMSRNFGVEACMMAGMAATKGDAVIYLDTDLQDPPELIPTLVQAWQKDPEVEVAYTTRLSRAGEHPLKLWLTNIGYKTLKVCSNIEVVPNAGDYRLLSRRVVNELLRLSEKKPYFRGLVTWIGFKQVPVQYHRDARYAGDTKRPVYSPSVINYFLDSALISFSDVPLKIALLLGFVVSLGAFLWLVGVVIMKLFHLAVPGWAAMMVTMLMLGGVQLLTIGVLGLYINAIYRETRHRPHYIIKDTLGFDEK
jgi:glycosyltransferase involved in cell wall biosynthesis